MLTGGLLALANLFCISEEYRLQTSKGVLSVHPFPAYKRSDLVFEARSHDTRLPAFLFQIRYIILYVDRCEFAFYTSRK